MIRPQARAGFRGAARLDQDVQADTMIPDHTAPIYEDSGR